MRTQRNVVSSCIGRADRVNGPTHHERIGLRGPFLRCRSIGMTWAGEGFSSVQVVETSNAYRVEPITMTTRLVTMIGGSSLTIRSRGFLSMTHMYLEATAPVATHRPLFDLALEVPRYRSYRIAGVSLFDIARLCVFCGALQLGNPRLNVFDFDCLRRMVQNAVGSPYSSRRRRGRIQHDLAQSGNC